MDSVEERQAQVIRGEDDPSGRSRTYAGVPVIRFRMLSTAGRTRLAGCVGRTRPGNGDRCRLGEVEQVRPLRLIQLQSPSQCLQHRVETPDRFPRSIRA